MRKVKSIFALIMSLFLVFSLSIPALAKEENNNIQDSNEEIILPRAGHSGYIHYYHNGNSLYGSATCTANFIIMPQYHWTLKTSGFPERTRITCNVTINGKQINEWEVRIMGNHEIKDLPLISGSVHAGDMIMLVCKIERTDALSTSAAGSVEAWFY